MTQVRARLHAAGDRSDLEGDGGVALSARQGRILSQLRLGGHIEVKELAASLGVDGSTIRRDLQQLSRTGQVERIHGGVRLSQSSSGKPGQYAKRRANLAVASTARTFVEDGQSIMIGFGGATDRFVSTLMTVSDLTVITNDLRAAELLSQHSGIHVLAAGGELRDAPASAVTSGHHTVAFLRDQRADWAFLEVDGVHPYAGVTTSSTWHVATYRAMLESSARRCVLATSDRFGVRGVGFVVGTDDVDLIITDEDLPDADLPAFGGRVVRSALEAADDWSIDVDRYSP